MFFDLIHEVPPDDPENNLVITDEILIWKDLPEIMHQFQCFYLDQFWPGTAQVHKSADNFFNFNAFLIWMIMLYDSFAQNAEFEHNVGNWSLVQVLLEKAGRALDEKLCQERGDVFG